MSRKSYKVLRSHSGDKPYAVGDIRVANAASVTHLIGTVLEEVSDAPAPKKLIDIPGVGPSSAAKLKSAGYDTAEKVLALSQEDLVAAGISPANAAKITATPGK